MAELTPEQVTYLREQATSAVGGRGRQLAAQRLQRAGLPVEEPSAAPSEAPTNLPGVKAALSFGKGPTIPPVEKTTLTNEELDRIIGSDDPNYEDALPAQLPGEEASMQLPPFPGLGTARRGLREARESVALAEDEFAMSEALGEAGARAGAHAAKQKKAIFDDYREDMETLQAARAERIQQAQGDLNKFTQAYLQAQNISPDQALIKQETRAGVAATLVQGLGAIAAIWSRGQQNMLAPMAQQLINRAERAIERDIRTKIQKRDALKVSLTLADKRLDDVRQHFADKEAYVTFLKDLEMERILGPILTRQANAKDAAARAAAQGVQALNVARAKESVATKEASVAQMGQQHAAAMAQAQAEMRQPFQGLRDESKTKAAEKWSTLKTAADIKPRLVAVLKELNGLDAIMGKSKPGNTDYDEAEQMSKQLMVILGEFGKALTQTEIDIQESILGDPATFRSSAGRVLKALNNVLRSKAVALEAFVEGEGGTIGPKARRYLEQFKAPTAAQIAPSSALRDPRR